MRRAFNSRCATLPALTNGTRTGFHMRMVQRDLQERLRAETVAARDRIAAAVRPLDPARLVERTEPGWSAAEVLEHLLVTEESYEVGVQQALRAARPDAAAPMREWRSSILGGFIAD